MAKISNSAKLGLQAAQGGTAVPVDGKRAGAAYRPDIDGLRALAVLPILLYHLRVPGWSGGFIGVDIFFVISGFLIGGITMRELSSGTFSLKSFYQRRLRRIFPALVVMIAGTSLAAQFTLLPTELEKFGWSAAATLLFSANLYFWQAVGYFADSAHSKPLLHAWSLGVEEQFYLLFPLVAIVATRLRTTLVWPIIAGLAATSFVVSIWLTETSPEANFYLLPSRAWELLGGVLVAITPLRLLYRRWIRESLAVGGVLLIAYALMRYNEYTPFPGLRALPPCLGAAAILAAGSGGATIVGSVLSLRPLRFVGLISYSLYLWHWPVIVLALRGSVSDHLSPGMMLGLGFLSFILAVASWRWVEEPFRRSKAPPKRVFISSGIAGGFALSAALVLALSDGLPSRFGPVVNHYARYLNYDQVTAYRSGTCFLNAENDKFDFATCLGGPSDKPTVLLIGDSHAAHLLPGLKASFEGIGIAQATASGCRPLAIQARNTAPRCRKLMRWIYERYLLANPPDLLILAGLWREEDIPSLQATLMTLKKYDIQALVIGPQPVWRHPVPRLISFGLLRDDPGLLYRRGNRDVAHVERLVRHVTITSGAKFYSVQEELCRPQCRAFTPQGELMFWDRSHLTAEGSQYLASKIKRAIAS